MGGVSTPERRDYKMMAVQGSTPATPASGWVKIFVDGTGMAWVNSSGTVTRAGGADWASPGAIGATTPAAGTFTTLTINTAANIYASSGTDIDSPVVGLKAYNPSAVAKTYTISAQGDEGDGVSGFVITGAGSSSDFDRKIKLLENGNIHLYTASETGVIDIKGVLKSAFGGFVEINDEIKFSGAQGTGAGSAALGSNSPATTLTAPYKWITVYASDGTTCYLPIWK